MKGLYKITAGRDEGVFEVRLSPGHAIFRGHFPGNPILPGICSLMMIRECASRMAGSQLAYASIRESKFLSAIMPDARPTVKLKLAKDGDIYSVDAVICEEETTMMKLTANLRADE